MIQHLSVPEELVHPVPILKKEDQNVSAARDRGDQNGIKESMNVDQKNHNHQMESTTRQENQDSVEVQQQSSDTVQHKQTDGYLPGCLKQQLLVYLATPYFVGGSHVLPYQATSSCYWSLCPIVFASSYHVMY